MLSFTACAPVMYLALVLDNAMEDCFLELQLITAPDSMNMNPEVDFQSFMLLAQLAST
jgi:hypothetical protein